MKKIIMGTQALVNTTDEEIFSAAIKVLGDVWFTTWIRNGHRMEDLNELKKQGGNKTGTNVRNPEATYKDLKRISCFTTIAGICSFCALIACAIFICLSTATEQDFNPLVVPVCKTLALSLCAVAIMYTFKTWQQWPSKAVWYVGEPWKKVRNDLLDTGMIAFFVDQVKKLSEQEIVEFIKRSHYLNTKDHSIAKKGIHELLVRCATEIILAENGIYENTKGGSLAKIRRTFDTLLELALALGLGNHARTLRAEIFKKATPLAMF
jgi:hypothetical protein